MELEKRYIVLKESDVLRLDPKAQAQLQRLVGAHDFVRELRGAEPLKGVFVESDWPEYERAKLSILRRAAASSYSPRWYLWDALGMAILLTMLVAVVG